MAMKGIDISKWQGNVDFNKVKADGIQFCIFREGYRQAIDGQFKNYVKGAKAAGIPILGVYHFIYVDGATPKQNAEACIANMKVAGLEPASTWIFSDLEYDTWTKAGIKVTKALCTQYTIEFLSTLKAAGCKKLGVYCNLDYYRNYYDWNQLSEYRKYLWLADYTGGPDVDCVIQQTSSTGKVSGISGNVDMDTLFDESMLNDGEKEDAKVGVTAQDVLNVMRSWIGYSEANGRYLEILNIYNSHKPLARGYAIKPSDEWCDATVSAAAIKAGAVDLIGTEVGVEKHVDIFKKKGIWIEDGSIKPQSGDIIVFNWDDSSQPNDGYSDHIGYVEQVSGNTITCIEGNMSEKVGRRTINVGWGYIRGFARPKYASGGAAPKPNPDKSISEVAQEVIQGAWGNGDARKNALTVAGYDYATVQAEVNRTLGGGSTVPKKSVNELAKEVIAGKWGNGDARKTALANAGYDCGAVQNEVNRILGGANKKSIDTLAREVIQGKWGNGSERKDRLTKAGYDYNSVQARVNQLL